VRVISPLREPSSQEASSDLSPEQKRDLVQRVINSQAFQRSSAMRAFLLYITEHEISGSKDQLKEQLIGAEVLGRRPNYDPADDNIVRVRAHELRGRLEKYFSSDGIEEPTLITVPRGSYAPEFVPRKAAGFDKPAAAPQAIETALIEPRDRQQSLRRHWLPLAAMLLLTISASIVATIFFMRAFSRTAALPSPAMRDFWGQFFDKQNKDLKLVYADTNFALWQDLNGRTLDLGSYLSRKYLDVPDDKFNEVSARLATSPADLAVSVRIAALTARFNGQVNAQFARNATAEFLHQGNIVLVGSHRSNPWMEVFEPNLNFQLAQDPRSGAPVFLNRSPQHHEPSEYAIPASLDTQGDEEREFSSYGVLALLRECGDRGLVVIDEGLNMQATEAVGDLIADPQGLETLLRSIGHRSGTTVAPFEALIQITSLPGGYHDPRVIAYRPRPPEACVGN